MAMTPEARAKTEPAGAQLVPRVLCVVVAGRRLTAGTAPETAASARRRRSPPGITGHHVQHPADVPEYRVHTPETSPGEHGRLAALRQHGRGSPHDPRDPQRREPLRFHLTHLAP